jgi:hypothetical protein
MYNESGRERAGQLVRRLEHRLRARGEALVRFDPLLQGRDAIADAAAQLVVGGAIAFEARFGEPAFAEFQKRRCLIRRQQFIRLRMS